MNKRIPPLPPDNPPPRNFKSKMTDEQRAYFKREFKVLNLSALCYLGLLFVGWLVFGMRFFDYSAFICPVFFGLCWFFDRKIK